MQYRTTAEKLEETMETAARSVSDNPLPIPKNLFSSFPIEVLTAKAISPGARLLHAFILFVSGWPNRTRPIWYSSKTIAQKLGMGQRTIERFMAELKRMNLIARWFDPSGKTMTIPKKITTETLKNIDPSIVSARFGEWAKLAGGLRHIGGGGPPDWRVDTDLKKQTYETSASRPPDAKFVEDSAVRKRATKSMTQCANDASSNAEAMEEKNRLKRRESIQTNLAKQGVERWKGTKFFKFFAERCAVHGVTICDDIENAIKYVPPRYAKAMNDIIGKIETRGLSKRNLAEILDKITAGWNGEDGFAIYFIARQKWRTHEISIYLIRKRFDDVVRLTGFDRMKAGSGARLKIPKGSMKDFVGKRIPNSHT